MAIPVGLVMLLCCQYSVVEHISGDFHAKRFLFLLMDYIFRLRVLYLEKTVLYLDKIVLLDVGGCVVWSSYSR
jgi:hypothetical protein